MTESIHYLTGAYAVDAVDDLERARFETHLRDCEDCREEIASLRVATTELGASLTTAPPPELRAAVLESITRVRPLPPLVAHPPIPAETDGVTQSAAFANIPGPRHGNVVDLRPVKRWRLLAAAAAVLAVGSLTWGAVSQNSASSSRQEAAASISQIQSDTAEGQQLKKLLGAQDLKMDAATDASTGIVTTVYRSPSLGTSAAMFSNLPDLSKDQQFEAWNQDPSFQVSPAGVFDAYNGRALHMLSGKVSTAQALAVTVEARGGAVDDKPTGQPIVQLAYSK